MAQKSPILLSFNAIYNGTSILLMGQIIYTSLEDLTFIAYTRRKTFRTLLSLYRTKALANEEIELKLDQGKVKVKTSKTGAFFEKVTFEQPQTQLEGITLSTGKEVLLIKDLYTGSIQSITKDEVVISDIDDTLLHSHIKNKFLKFRTLMFTKVENRKTVKDIQHLIQTFHRSGATAFYLSNSEQNLYPLIYRFLINNKLPSGPLFLKDMRRIKDILTNQKTPYKDVHKIKNLENIIEFLPGKEYILIGDNTQNDLSIYLTIAERFPKQIRYIIIRKVIERSTDQPMIAAANEFLQKNNIGLYYESCYPSDFELKNIFDASV